jgi:hypothetical protein
MLATLCFGVTTNTVFLTGIQEASPHYRYSVDWGHLPPKVSWCPGAEPLPFDICSEAERVRSLVAASKGITNGMNLSSIRIQRLFIPRWQLEARCRNAQDFTNNWFVAFSWRLNGTKFEGTPLSRHEHAVMLPDGTLATEKVGPNQLTGAREGAGHSRSLQSSGFTNPSIRPAPGELGDGSRTLAGLDAPDFRIPNVQWIPEGDPLPMDLSKQSLRAARLLAEHAGAPAGLILRQILMANYFPSGAIQAKNGDIEKNLNHWIITFSFARPSSPTESAYEVNMLLDGRVLNAVEAPLSARRSISVLEE